MFTLIAASVIFGIGSVKVEQTKFENWTGCYRISNKNVDLVVVPQIGRIMRFGRIGQRNLLWEGPLTNGHPPDSGGWANWGGDKVWPAPQSNWNWPPENEYDGAAWDAAPIKNGVRMTSRTPSKRLGVRFVREITLEPGSWQATSRAILVNHSAQLEKVGPWEICQVDDPGTCILPPGRQWRYLGDHPSPIQHDEHGIALTRNKVISFKCGGYSPEGTLRALFSGYQLTIHADARPQSAGFPDGGCNLELYCNADPLKYCELEVLGPIRALKPGGSTSMTVTLKIDALVSQPSSVKSGG